MEKTNKIFRLFAGILVVLVSFSITAPNQAYADGSLLKKTPRVIVFKNLEFTQSQFRRLSQAQLEAIKNSKPNMRAIRIEGFGRSVYIQNVVCMAVCMRSRTKSLMGRMQRVGANVDERRRELEDELEWADDTLDKVSDNVIRIMDRPSNVINDAMLKAEETRQENLRCYIKSLRKWLRRPNQGALRS